MPEDVVFDHTERGYPTPAIGLMENPFPNKRSKKKKKRRVVPVTRSPLLEYER